MGHLSAEDRRKYSVQSTDHDSAEEGVAIEAPVKERSMSFGWAVEGKGKISLAPETPTSTPKKSHPLE